MKRPVLIVLLLVVAFGLVWALLRDPVDNETDVQALAQREAQRAAASLAAKTDLAELGKQGLGQELPNYLIKELGPGGRYWFVGKPDRELGVEIPFEPGKIPEPPANLDPLTENPGYLGAEACRSCHADKYETFIHTAHHRTTRRAGAETISGTFQGGNNVMRTLDPEVYFTMVQRDGRFFQRTSFFDWEFEVPTDLIIGSSKMAESYLYWHGDELYQLNCTHLAESDAWINSPGFLDGDAAFARPIQAGCLECHTTYIELREPPNHFTPSTLIAGISCERCHGPGKQHVDYHAVNPEVKGSHFITIPSDLSREREMDVCGQCHTSNKAPKQEDAFHFRPGDELSEHYDKLEDYDESANSVHTSNQIARLALSECFKQSEMACVECHNPHKNERGDRVLFSQRCLNCHAEEHCGMSEQLGEKLAGNCVDCHMPRRGTENLRAETAAGNVFLPLRDHYIRVDQQATAEYLQSIDNP